MDLIKKVKRSIVSVARPREFFGFEEGLHDSAVKVKPLGVSRKGTQCRGVPLVRGVDCFKVRGEVFKRVVAHVWNYILPGDSSRTNCEGWLGGAGSYEPFV